MPIKTQRFWILLTSVLLVGISSNSSAQTGSFEGNIYYEIKSLQLGDAPIEATVSIKGDKTLDAMDVPGAGKMAFYIDKAQHTVTDVMEPMKVGQIIDLPAVLPKADSIALVSFRPTGRTEVINGFKCAEYTANTNSDHLTVWATADIDATIRSLILTLSFVSVRGDRQHFSPYQVLDAKGLTPVRMIQSSGPGDNTTIDLVKIAPKKIADSVFVIPADIKVQKMTPPGSSQPNGSKN